MGSSVALCPLKANSSLSMGFHIVLATRQWQPCLLNLLLQPAWLPLAHELASRQAVPVGSWGGGCPLSGGAPSAEVTLRCPISRLLPGLLISLQLQRGGAVLLWPMASPMVLGFSGCYSPELARLQVLHKGFPTPSVYRRGTTWEKHSCHLP